MQNYPPLSRASIVQIEGAFAACSAERLAFALVLWNPGNTWWKLLYPALPCRPEFCSLEATRMEQ